MTSLVPLDPEQVFVLADRIAASPLLPDAYRNKPRETAIAMMYGAEIGFPPMTSLQRIVVINGKPTLDAQGMVALIRAKGHSIEGEKSATEAVAVGKRIDNGDEMKVTFTIDDARTAGLVRQGSPWTKFPKSMLWARAVSQLARELFADVLLGMSYVPEEMEAVQGAAYQQGNRTLTFHDEKLPPGEFIVVNPEQSGHIDMDTGEIIDLHPTDVDTQEGPAPLPFSGPGIDLDALNKRDPGPTERERIAVAKDGLTQIIAEVVPDAQRLALKGYLVSRFGASKDLTLEDLVEATRIAAGWPVTEETSEGAPF